MVDNLNEKLGTFRRIWNERVQANFENMLIDKLEEHMKKDKDETPETPDDVAEETPAKVIGAAFDLSVWQFHDVDNKLNTAFGANGWRYIDAPADAFPKAEPSE